MTRVLQDGGLEVVGEGVGPNEIVEEAIRLQPDAIVLGIDGKGSTELGERVRSAVPGIKLILWPRDEMEMQVFDPGSAYPRRIGLSASRTLLRELGTE